MYSYLNAPPETAMYLCQSDSRYQQLMALPSNERLRRMHHLLSEADRSFDQHRESNLALDAYRWNLVQIAESLAHHCEIIDGHLYVTLGAKERIYELPDSSNEKQCSFVIASVKRFRAPLCDIGKVAH